MTGRDWLLILGTGLTLHLVPACSHRVHLVPERNLLNLPAPQTREIQTGAPLAAEGSPYHPHSPFADRVKDAQFERAHYAAAQRREPTPRSDFLSSLPVTPPE